MRLSPHASCAQELPAEEQRIVESDLSMARPTLRMRSGGVIVPDPYASKRDLALAVDLHLVANPGREGSEPHVQRIRRAVRAIKELVDRPRVVLKPW